MIYQVKFSMHPNGPFVERDCETLKQEFTSGRIKADTMVRANEWDPWIPIITALDIPPSATKVGTAAKVIETKCPKCDGKMTAGFILELGDSGSTSVSRWIAGVPEKSFWAGGLKTTGREQYDVQTYRCKRCGFLESYAPRQ